MDAEIKKLAVNGLWKNNPVLVQILGLCPLLAVSNSGKSALGLGLATIFVLILSNVLVSATRQYIRPEIRIPVFVLLIASAVTMVEIIMQAYVYDFYQQLGIFLSLIVTNCVIIARAEAYAFKNSLKYAFWDGLLMGLGFALGLLLLGICREYLAYGSIFEIQITKRDNPLILAVLPAGAFFCYALLIAGKNAIELFLIKK